MAPVPIHKNAPITAAKPSGVTPSTATAPNDPTTTTTTTPPTRTTPASVPATTTATATASYAGPPPPQPGARPAAPTATSSTGTTYSPGPAPPQPGPTATMTVVTTETRQGGVLPPPPQFAQPPPTTSGLAGRSTTTTTAGEMTPSRPGPGPTTLNYGPVASPFQDAHSTTGVASAAGGQGTSLQHPPGYVQAPDNAPYTAGGEIGGQGGAAAQEGVGATAWGMLSKAGEALKSGEEAVWRAVKGK